jgi:hypothetical protein
MALDLGPCQVLFGTAAAEVDIGKTQGGVRVAFSEDVVDLMSDQYGSQPEDQSITGHTATIVTALADYSVANLAIALNQDELQLGSKKGFKGSSLVGTKLSTKGQSLLLKKYVDGIVSTDENDWIRFPVAAPTGAFELTFDGATQRVIEITFQAFPDANSILYFVGDEDAAESGS